MWNPHDLDGACAKFHQISAHDGHGPKNLRYEINRFTHFLLADATQAQCTLLQNLLQSTNNLMEGGCGEIVCHPWSKTSAIFLLRLSPRQDDFLGDHEIAHRLVECHTHKR